MTQSQDPFGPPSPAPAPAPQPPAPPAAPAPLAQPQQAPAGSAVRPQQAPAAPVLPAAPKFPVFATVMASVDLGFCLIRVLIVLLGIVGLIMTKEGDPAYATGGLEIITGIGIVLFGIPANVLLLLRKPSGLPLGYLNLLFTGASMLVGLLQGNALFGKASDGAQAAGIVVGLGLVLVIRLALLLCYGVALNLAKKFFASAAP